HGKPLVFVMNAATARARITGESAVALSQHGTVAPVRLHHRVDFAASMIDGKTIGEIHPKGRSSPHIAELWSYIGGRLARITGAHGLAAPHHADASVRTLTALSPAGDAVADEADEPAPPMPHFAVEPPPIPA